MIKIVRMAITTATLLAFAGCATAQKPQTLANGKSHFATFGTNQIHYVTVGHGARALVFVHGWAGNLDLWREQVPALADKARLILIDLPGHGQSDKPRTDYTLDFFAGAVLAVMADAQADKATLIGHSMGGSVICRVYAQAPEKVAALVSVDGLLRRPEGTRAEAEAMIGQFATPDYRQNAINFIAALFGTNSPASLRDEITAEMLQTPQYVMFGAMLGMFGPNQSDWDLKKVNVPVLVFNARGPLWNDGYEKYVHSLSPQTDYQLFDGAGHWLMLQQPAEFNAALVAALQKYDLIANK